MDHFAFGPPEARAATPPPPVSESRQSFAVCCLLGCLMTSVFAMSVLSCGTTGSTADTPDFVSVRSVEDAAFAEAELALWIKEDDEEDSWVIVAGKEDVLLLNTSGEVVGQLDESGRVASPTIGYAMAFGDGSEADLLGYIDLEENVVRLRRLPDLTPVDAGGWPLAHGATLNSIVLYTRDHDDVVFMLVNTLEAHEGVWQQYQLVAGEGQTITAAPVRSFGKHDGDGPIVAAHCDMAQEYFYYIDPGVGIRKYAANPRQGDEELGLLSYAANDFIDLGSYEMQSHGGYIAATTSTGLVFFGRGEIKTPHRQPVVQSIDLPVEQFILTSMVLDQRMLAKGLLVALDGQAIHWYDWQTVAGDQLVLAPNGIPDYTDAAVKPKFITEPTPSDTDDPAIWIHPEDPARSLIIGTDKEDGGGLYVYDLQGKILRDKVVTGMHRPNNVDLEYGLPLQGQPTDFIIATERNNEDVRIFSFPDMQPIDGGGIPVFEGEDDRDPMGVAIYKRPRDQSIFAIVGRKTGPSDAYLWQYRLDDDGSGQVRMTKVRAFGKYSGQKEIEAIAVDDKLGYVYYSDEGVGIRKYYADPDKGNQELALFGQWDFGQDHEGISIFDLDDQRGYILVSDQQRNRFNVYPREGTDDDPHQHELITSIEVSTMESDGSEVTSLPLGDLFPHGLFVAMSTDKTFHLYDWRDIAGEVLERKAH